MPAKKKTTKKAQRSGLATPAMVAENLSATPKAPRPLTVRERIQNMSEQIDRVYNDAKQAQRERDGLLALIAIAEGQRCIRRTNDGSPY